MARGRRRKCKCCRKLFRPDPRNLRHQRYCSKPSCRAARKAASQARWLAQPENHDYFRGPVHLARSRAWRACKVLIWPFVSPRWSLRADLRSPLLTASITLGKALTIAFFCVIDVLKGMVERVGESFHHISGGTVSIRNT
jgi:hypothetical protein